MARSLLISEAFELYRTDFIAFKGQSKKTEEAYIAARNELLRRFGDVDICALTFNDVRDWKLWLDKGRSPNTVRCYIISLRNVLRFLSKRGYAVLNPDDIPVPKRLYKEVEYLTEKEFDNFILEVAKPRRGYSSINRYRNVAMIELLYATGLRNHELCGLNRNSIKNNTFTVIGKGNKPRIGFVSAEAMALIQLYLNKRTDNHPALFIAHQTGARMTTSNLREVFHSVCSRSEFIGIHPHTIRHSYATKLLKKRVDLRYIAEFMGHSSIDTTKIYTHYVNTDLKRIYDEAHQI